MFSKSKKLTAIFYKSCLLAIDYFGPSARLTPFSATNHCRQLSQLVESLTLLWPHDGSYDEFPSNLINVMRHTLAAILITTFVLASLLSSLAGGHGNTLKKAKLGICSVVLTLAIGWKYGTEPYFPPP